jgi:Ni/Co efflux regulator RcnB
MKRLIPAALALSLLGGASAYAQQSDNQGDRGRGAERPAQAQQAAPRGQTQAAPQQNAGRPQQQGLGAGPNRFQPQQQRQAQPQAQAQAQPQAQPQQQRQAQPQAQAQAQQQPFGRQQGGQQGARPSGQAFSGGRGGVQSAPAAPQAFSGRPSGQAYNGQAYNGGGGRGGVQTGSRQGREWRAPQRFRGASYSFPRGYGYQAWGFGQYLPGSFFISDYVLYNYWAYGLEPPPPGFEWIRVGPDALLVQDGSGYILDAVRDLFY